jgi:hypothetical protein
MIHSALQTTAPTGTNDDAISTNDNTRIIFSELPPPPLLPPDEDVSINNLRMSIVYHRVTVKSNSLFRKWVCRFIGQIYIFQVHLCISQVNNSSDPTTKNMRTAQLTRLLQRTGCDTIIDNDVDSVI